MEGGEHHRDEYYKKGLWTEEEDKILMDYIMVHGKGRWNRVPRITGLKRCGKSCRLRWINYLSPNVKRGEFTEQEDDLIIRLHKLLGNRWALIAGRVPGRTDNQVKNHWNTHLSKKLGVSKGMINKRKHGVSSSPVITNSSANGAAAVDNKLKLIRMTATDSFTKLLQTSSNPKDEITASASHETDQTLNYNNNGGQEGSGMDECLLGSFWFFNEDYCLEKENLAPATLLEIPDGYPLDVVWQTI